MSSTTKSLIMGVAAGYTNNLILPFLKSLWATDYLGKVCLFVGNTSDEAIAELKTYADDVIVLDGIYGNQITKHRVHLYVSLLAKIRNMRRVRRAYPTLFKITTRLAPPQDRKSLQLDLEQKLEGFQALRYHHYRKYLEDIAPDADFVMITDVRDVIFQSDPFAHDFSNDLEIFLEADHVKVKNAPFDSRWMRNLYGPGMLNRLGENTVSCSGTTMGTRNGLLRYLGIMESEILKHERPLGSHDQGIHNYLHGNKTLDPVTIYKNGEGPVLTLGLEKEVNLDSQRRFLNRDGSIAPVVHQYDRHVDLAAELWQRYA